MHIKMAIIKSRLQSTLTRKKKNQRGVTAVEMALIAPAFFTLLIGVTELGLLLTAQQILEHAAFSTSRLAKTGYTASGQTQIATVTAILANELESYGNFINMDDVVMTSKTYNSFTAVAGGNGTSGLGLQQQVVVYTVTMPWKVFTPLMADLVHATFGKIQLKTRIVVRNEPYAT